MKLLTKAMEQRFKKLGKQDIPDPVVVAKFFHPISNWTWFATAYDPKSREFFGMVHGLEKELGYFRLDELEGIRVHGLPIERDLWFKERKLSEVRDGIG